ncbi:hypothetical protein ASE17_05075 [Phenylobacterium sp. Root77]|uniref:FecR family protein n=1 Tax=unclassified Phenylobacterium TaxID=2640670 RepID=UPI0007016605|nr:MULTISPECIES: FecR domain-containing protein [unclassified Phenylobacterium]KQW72243.1 hypothetical protein ASC73_09305 [Phenylobacterium sp. Root1277]KQW95162.1 hypothetical protein ASC79_05445 [Phenylobacterium sp. Root1290]KRC44855.1 hypothetical protein ASE17_05075 [Phenylobacterium sp. Root77]
MTADAAPDQVEKEAADWFARLNKLSITTKALEDFHAWRRDPAHDAAYERIEALWETAGRLGKHPDTARDVAAALARGRRKRRFARLGSRPARIGAGLATVTAAAALVFTFAIERPTPYATGLGEQRLVSLDDGSRLRLDTSTQVRVKFKPDRREVVLVHGQAFFDVAHDTARPFVVMAGDQSIRALGTRFDVRNDAGDVRVTLVQGAVEVSRQSDGQTWRLAPGQGLAVRGQTVAPPKAVDVTAATSWTSGRLVFRAAPLGEAVAEVNRYSADKIALDNAELRNVPVSGVFDVGDTRAFVSAVSELFNLRAVETGDGYRLEPRA